MYNAGHNYSILYSTDFCLILQHTFVSVFSTEILYSAWEHEQIKTMLLGITNNKCYYSRFYISSLQEQPEKEKKKSCDHLCNNSQFERLFLCELSEGDINPVLS